MRDLPLPPLARGLPLVGSVPQLTREGMLRFVESEWHRLGDIFRISLFNKTLVIVGHPAGVERILSSHRENYIKGKTYDAIRLMTGDGLLTLEGDAWLKRRRLEQPAFHRDSIRRLTSTMVDVTRKKLARWRSRLPEGGVLEAHQAMLELTLEVVGETLFGQTLSEESTDTSGKAFTEALKLISERGNSGFELPLVLPTPKNRRLKASLATLDSMVRQIIAQARAQPDEAARPTLLSMLLHSRDADTGEPLTDTDLRNEVITLFLAGHETTALLLSWAFTLLKDNPQVVAQMRAEVTEVLGDRTPTPEDIPRLTFLRQVVDETLRLRSPTWTVARDVVADDVLLGHKIRAGDTVLPVSYLVHRHKEFWDQPERFWPERFSPDGAKGRNTWCYFPFSLGPRMCIGNVFSLVESQIVLAMMLQKMDFEVPPGPAVEPDAQITLRPTAPIPLRVRWRS